MTKEECVAGKGKEHDMWSKLVDLSASHRKLVALAGVGLLLILLFLTRNMFMLAGGGEEPPTPAASSTVGTGETAERTAKSEGFLHEGIIIPYPESTLQEAVRTATDIVGILTDPRLTPRQKLQQSDTYTSEGLPIFADPSISSYTEPPVLQPLRFESISADHVTVDVSANETPYRVTLTFVERNWIVTSVTTEKMRENWGQSA